MPIRLKILGAALVCSTALLPACAAADDFDTEHLFGFMIGTDVGEPGEREFQSGTTGRFAKNEGRYRAATQEFELEFSPVKNIRLEVGTAFVGHRIEGVPDLDDRRQFTWQEAGADFRYRFLERDAAPFGLTFAIGSQFGRVDETSGEEVRNFSGEFVLAFDRELFPGHVLAALNLIYEPEWTRSVATGDVERESTIGAAFGAMVQIRPGFLLGGEARYLRQYEGFGLQEFAGEALFAGPTAYVQLSESSWLTASWSVQAWGRSAGSNATLDLVNFERHEARLVFGVNF